MLEQVVRGRELQRRQLQRLLRGAILRRRAMRKPEVRRPQLEAVRQLQLTQGLLSKQPCAPPGATSGRAASARPAATATNDSRPRSPTWATGSSR